MKKGLDCVTKLTPELAKNLKDAGFTYVARYLGDSWKTFDKKEAETIHHAGLSLISIFQRSANRASYFSEEQGKEDGKLARKYAEVVGQPKGTAIYFAVDYDVSQKEMTRIFAYINGVKNSLYGYEMGVYGSYAVMVAVKEKVPYLWQTYAWSRGEVADFVHMYQYENDVMVAGVAIDRNQIFQDPGAWIQRDEDAGSSVGGKSKVIATKMEGEQSEGTSTQTASNQTKGKHYQVHQALNAYLTALEAKNGINKKGLVQPGSYYIFNEAFDMVNVTKKKGVPGSWINPKEQATLPQYHLVQRGDTLTKIAKNYQTTLTTIQKLNPTIKNIHLIYPNQKIRVR